MIGPESLTRSLAALAHPWRWRFLTLSTVTAAGLWLGLGRTEAHPAGPGEPETESIAVVDGEEISRERFNQRWQPLANNLRLKDGHLAEPMAGAQKAHLAEQLIDEALIEHAAEQEQLLVSEEALDAAMASRRNQLPDASLKHAMLLPEEARRKVRLELLVDQLVERRVPRTFPDDALQAFHERNPERFQVPTYVEVEDLLVAVSPEMKDAELLARQQEAEAMREQILPPSHGGLATAASLPDGVRTRLTSANVPADVWERLSDLSAREVSPVLRTEQGFHLYRLVERGPVVTPPFAAVRDRVGSVMRSELLELRRAGLRHELRSTALIENHLAARQAELAGPRCNGCLDTPALSLPQPAPAGKHE
ncbi:peptidyl-prolyl cis-trans isomerase [Corallococcus llansteffanensis]|uniref:Peptidyl-prolyl cis-trans isomerase n=1 Tax=Corallococcus llansteffanensis TaxID=2316731 RepID=A0A3A8PWZ0_9BACT|nr:peptidyl-prolyl cis-trans isomerase [Corallococcus llansteffanensis]